MLAQLVVTAGMILFVKTVRLLPQEPYMGGDRSSEITQVTLLYPELEYL